MKKLISMAVAALLASSLATPSFADKGGVPNEKASEKAVGRDGDNLGNKGGNGGGKGHDNDSPGHTSGEGDGSGN